jgi:DNA-directed RNA polymerase specialized sigma subunit
MAKSTKATEIFSLTKARELEQTKGVKAAIRYAAPFTTTNKNAGNRLAKNYVISIIQNRDGNYTKDESDSAWSVFVRFFDHYLSSVIDRYYTNVAVEPAILLEKKEEAKQSLWVYVVEQINKFDPYKGQITTFFRDSYLMGKISDTEAKARSNVRTRRNLETDKFIENARKDLVAQLGTEPTLAQILEEVKKRMKGKKKSFGISQIQISLERVDQTNNMKSLDFVNKTMDDDVSDDELGDKMESRAFLTPEESAIQNERAENLYKALHTLSYIERSVLLFKNGMEFVDGMIQDRSNDDTTTEKQFAATLGINPSDMKLFYTTALDKLSHSPYLVSYGKKKDNRIDNNVILMFSAADDLEWDDGLMDIAKTYVSDDKENEEKGGIA